MNSKVKQSSWELFHQIKWDYEKNIIPFLKLMDKNLNHKLKIILGGGWKLNFQEFKHIEEILLVNGFEDFDYMLTKI